MACMKGGVLVACMGGLIISGMYLRVSISGMHGSSNYMAVCKLTVHNFIYIHEDTIIQVTKGVLNEVRQLMCATSCNTVSHLN